MKRQHAHGWKLIAILPLILCYCQRPQPLLQREIGVYPGAADENTAPLIEIANNEYRNLALLRRSFHSTSHDYNLTAQLITDGIIDTSSPYYINLSTSQGVVSRNEREVLLDHNIASSISLPGANAFIQLDLSGAERVALFDNISIRGEVACDKTKSGKWSIAFLASENGTDWTRLSNVTGSGLPGTDWVTRPFATKPEIALDTLGKPIDPMVDYWGPAEPGEPKPSFSSGNSPGQYTRVLVEQLRFKNVSTYKHFKLELSASGATNWTITDIDFHQNQNPVEIVPSHYFTSAWMSSGSNEEWVYVDLGASCTYDKIKLSWIAKPQSGWIQSSEDAVSWSNVISIPASKNLTDEISLEKAASSRYVRLLLNGRGVPVILSEFEIYGKGGVLPVPKPQPGVVDGHTLQLAGGDWKVRRASLVTDPGEILSTIDRETTGWLTATVPGTVLVSYLNAGAVPDPDFGDNQTMISESFFNSDFWYRNQFVLPQTLKGERLFLNFDGINWKADIYLNGRHLGSINGAFMHKRFDVTEAVVLGKENALAVLIHRNATIGCVTEQSLRTPDKNGGILGADNPTFHASIGWDWIPTIRGRNIGIWNDVYFTAKGAVTIDDPFVTTDLPLPDTTSCDVALQFVLRNHTSSEQKGKLNVQYGPATIEEEITLAANESRLVKFDPSKYTALHLENPRLWWPKGYGKPTLQEVKIVFSNANGGISDILKFKSGIREMSHTVKNNILYLYVNGRRFVGRGGNWGFPESNLRYRAREYDIAVKYHADMNFTMIRNWVGQTGDDEFFDACDKYGIMIWQDFWLANPWDGPDPKDNELFMANAEDFVTRIRNHPSIGIYVGRNEGNPPVVLDTAIRTMVAKLHSDIHYISNSAFGVVSGGGPYRALPTKDYFILYGRHKFHSERGMPNVMTYESMERMLPKEKLWPQNDQWGLHDYCIEGAQSAASFNQLIENAFGPSENAKQFTERAQWLNYEGYRAMFEGRSDYRQGLLLWMSHSAWPSMVWQTYDYYFEPTAAYFGSKKGCEPLHIQWNPVWDKVEVVNNYAGNKSNLKAVAEIINVDGAIAWKKDTVLNSRDDTTQRLFKLEFPQDVSPVHFIRMKLFQDQQLISENFYWRSVESGNYKALNGLPKLKLVTNVTSQRIGKAINISAVIENTTKVPALMIRLKTVRVKSGRQILPAFYSDNYIFLMPGESKTIQIEVNEDDTGGEEPAVEVSGFNVLPD